MKEAPSQPKIYVCLGPGGVGKTTVSAALAISAARAGKRVCLVTVDPAKRLADTLGIKLLGNEPTAVTGPLLGKQARGSLDAMMLDTKATFDDLIGKLLADSTKTNRLKQNRIYRQLEQTIAGMQEFTATEKLYELSMEYDYELIVLDTPPAEHALDLIDAPTRLSDFFNSRAIKLITGSAPGFNIALRGSGILLNILRKLTGNSLLAETREFFLIISEIDQALKEQAIATEKILKGTGTHYLAITTPTEQHLASVSLLGNELALRDLKLQRVILNQVHRAELTKQQLEAATKKVAPDIDKDLTERIRSSASDYLTMQSSEQAAIKAADLKQFTEEPVYIPALVNEPTGKAALQELVLSLGNQLVL